MQRFYKHTLHVTVLSEEELYDPFDIHELAWDITDGDYVGMLESRIDTIELTHDQVVEEMNRIGSDLSWFSLGDDTDE